MISLEVYIDEDLAILQLIFQSFCLWQTARLASVESDQLLQVVVNSDVQRQNFGVDRSYMCCDLTQGGDTFLYF